MEAQQSLGVVSGRVQMAGAQLLMSDLARQKSLETLVPAMNDLLVQQRGINATEQDAAEIGKLMSLAMQGQTSALAQAGLAFTAAEEQALRYGAEEERAAALAQVIANNVGGMNRALAATPEGGLRQHANTMADLQARIGRLAASLQVLLLPLFNVLAGVLAGVVGFFEGWMSKLQEGNVAVVALTAVLGSLAAAMGIMTSAVGLITGAKSAWAAVQGMLNLSMLACPLTWIVAGIVLLAGTIVYLCSHIEGWGSLWDGTVGFMKYSFLAFVDGVKLYFQTLVAGIMVGLDTVRLGWYKFREACGIGDSAENRAAIAGIAADMEARKQALVEGAQQVAENVRKAKESLSGIDMSWKGRPEKADDAGVGEAAMLFGSRPAGTLSGGFSGGFSGNMEGSAPAAGRGTAGLGVASAIAGGGEQHASSVTVNVGSLVERLVFEGGYDQNRDEMQSDLESALIRVLQMANSAQ